MHTHVHIKEYVYINIFVYSNIHIVCKHFAQLYTYIDYCIDSITTETARSLKRDDLPTRTHTHTKTHARTLAKLDRMRKIESNAIIYQ